MDVANRRTMVGLPEHLIIDQIIFRLPLKDAVRCKSLNKRFNTNLAKLIDGFASIVIMSKSFFHPFYYNIPLHPSRCHPDTHGAKTIVDHEILSFSSGLVVMKGSESGHVLCIFNPIIKKYKLIPCLWRPKFMGLAVEPGYTSNSKHHYTLVHAYVKAKSLNQIHQIQYIFAIFQSNQVSWRKADVKLSCKGSFPDVSPYCNGHSVYWQGSLHWLRDEGGIIAFNVKDEGAWIIETPPGLNCNDKGIWFGIAEDLITLVSTSSGNFVIHVLVDYNNFHWEIKHQIASTILVNEDYNYFVPFYDGNCLVLARGKCGEDGELFVHDVGSKEEKKIGIVRNFNELRFFHFVPFPNEISGVNNDFSNIIDKLGWSYFFDNMHRYSDEEDEDMQVSLYFDDKQECSNALQKDMQRIVRIIDGGFSPGVDSVILESTEKDLTP